MICATNWTTPGARSTSSRPRSTVCAPSRRPSVGPRERMPSVCRPSWRWRWGARAAGGGAGGGAAPPRGGPGAAIHGARQPLTAISGYTELLLGESIGLLGTNQRRFLERIRTAVHRIDDQLSVLAEALEQSRSSSAPMANDLATLLEQALEVIHEDLRAKGLSVRLDLPPAPVRVPGNPTSIRTIVARLLANAADVTPSGGRVCAASRAGGGPTFGIPLPSSGRD